MKTDFGGLDISYDDRVLTPRSWTQAQAHWATELLPDLPDGDALELCCGAGQIGLAAVAGTGRRLVAVDINPAAAHYAVRNADRAGVRLSMRLGSMRRMLGADEKFALILADPPWVPTPGIARFPEDPRTAIDGGHFGMDLIHQCLRIIDDHLAPGGVALLQVGPGDEQADAVAAQVQVSERRHFERGTLLLIEQQSHARTL